MGDQISVFEGMTYGLTRVLGTLPVAWSITAGAYLDNANPDQRNRGVWAA